MSTAPILVEPDFARRIASAAGPGATVTRIDVLSGGHSGLTHVADLETAHGLEQVAIKSTPPGREPRGRHDVLRQARVIAGLDARGDVPVAPVRFSDASPPPFFATALVPGVAVDPIIDPDATDVAPATVAARWDAAISVLTRLHATPPSAVGAGDEPVREPGEELAIWEATMRAAKMDDNAAVRRIVERMRATIPDARREAIVHGDFRLGNILFDGTRARALIDWEIWSVGDPAMDLGWFISFTDPANYPGIGREVPGTPSADSVLARYAELTSEDLDRLPWFLALGSFKLAAIQAHNRRRHLEGRYHDEFQSLLGPSIERLLTQAEQQLDS
jgi:aminoglycoside phosphotransferase (APT) family kinase protein